MENILLLFGLGVTEIILIALIVLLLFGASRIPKIMKSFGKGVRDMKKEYHGIKDEVDEIKSDIKSGIDAEPSSSGNNKEKRESAANDN
jgi:sec-independent protein translocase protein TatA